MNKQNEANQNYPVGEYSHPDIISNDHITGWIEEIEHFPKLLRETIQGWTEEQLSTRTKPDGWMVKQVIHHLADSHMNSFIRFKLALTEDSPKIKPYAEDRWAELIDGKDSNIESSLQILEGLHKRWVVLLRSLTLDDLEKSFFHSEHNKFFKLAPTIGLYAWHGRHHLCFIQKLKQRMKW
ncbi:MAG TPA: putative metal-dependent hydrolase [Leptospiraceae bacterium]|nr:putative metal-dependent hydrolase [Leptospiraceae bacterium]HMW05943.1 putative metal-dependent hydrolase [Leptospiraceae bacterium]HMX34545.1 putative metal-dependent hydrolase [Leptospiraceae bacterium]HMY32297.1 putative metal-dependent hydrolase [Leptospiraceae bacterium]HMZ62501.1 putative metal-dependent hydrolase [Leptospiraceae bacterium]